MPLIGHGSAARDALRDRQMAAPNADDQAWAEKTVFSTGEAAQVCNVSQQTIIRCFDSGRLQGFRVPGSKFRRIPREELIRFMRENGIPLGVLEGGVRRVLCIHEPPSPLERVAEALRGQPRVEVRVAAGAYDAGILTVQFRPHLILLDDGVDSVPLEMVAETARGMPAADRPRVVSVGRVEDEGDRARRLGNGADAVLSLPADPGSLVQRVVSLLEHTEGGPGDATA
jgi:excisionase family DNA binding protein